MDETHQNGPAQQASSSGDWFQEIAAFLPVGIAKADLRGIVHYANPVIMQMFALTPADIAAGVDIRDILLAEDASEVVQVLGALLAGRAPRPSRYRARDKDGSLFVIEALGAPILSDAQQPVGFAIAIRDVTAESHAEAFAERETELKLALGSAETMEGAMSLVVDAGMRLDGVDSACAYVAAHGGRSFHLISPRNLSEEFVREVAKHGTDPGHGGRMPEPPRGRTIRVDHQAILDSPDPSARVEGLHSLALVPMWYEDSPVSMVIVASHTRNDIPAATCAAIEQLVGQVAGSVARIRAEELRREAVETFEAIFSTVPLAIFAMDLKGRVTMWNEAATRTFGWSESEALGFPPRFVQEDRREEFREELARAFREGGFRGVEFDRQRKDGSTIFIRVSSALLRNSLGEVVGILAAAEDVTNERLSEQTQERLKRLESLGVLAGGIAHDFNNILMGIMGNLSLVQHEGDPVLRGHLIDEAQAAAEQAVGLTTQLVTFSKGGAPVKESLDLRTFLVDVVGRAAVAPPILLEFDLQATPRVEADPVQLREVVESLVANAVEAMPDGGSLRITSDEYVDADGMRFARFSMTDTGEGIRPEVLEHIFDPYFSTKEGGTGLGLSLAQSIVTQHGGELTVNSSEGATAFTVRLPAAVAGEAEPAPGRMEAGAAEGPVKVLIVDDEDMIRAILVRMLERLGCVAVPCASGEEAVSVLRQAVDSGQSFGIAITDLTMPGGMGGVETTKALLAIDPTVKVVVSSGYSDDPAMARFRDYGFVASVRKPYTLDALRQTLEACCELRPS